MAFRFRKESVGALEDLEAKQKEAAGLGPAAFSSFQETNQDNAIKEGKDIGALAGGDSSSSSDSSSDDSESDDSSDDSESNDPFATDDIDGGDTSDDSEGDSDSEEESPEDDAPPDEESEPEPEEDDSEAELKKESMRNLSYLPSEGLMLRQEDFGEFVKSVGNNTWDGLSFVTGALAGAGIRYTPMLLSGMLKVVLYTFAKTFKTLDTLFDASAQQLERFVNRTSKQKKTLEVLKESFKTLQEKGVELPEGAKFKMDASILCFQGSNEIAVNVAMHAEFMKATMGKLQKAILSDFNGLSQISQARYLSKNFDALSSMTIHPNELGFQPKGVGDLEEDTDVIQLYEMQPMIGDVAIQAKLPIGNFDTWNMVEKAYSASSIYLVPKAVRSVYETPLLSPEALNEFINHLELLVDASIEHQQFYEEIASKRSGVVNTVKQLFVRLCEEKVKVSFKNSVALPLHLKSSFVTKVYMVAAMDLHDHTARVIANGLSYASGMMNLYKAKAET